MKTSRKLSIHGDPGRGLLAHFKTLDLGSEVKLGPFLPGMTPEDAVAKVIEVDPGKYWLFNVTMYGIDLGNFSAEVYMMELQLEEL